MCVENIIDKRKNLYDPKIDAVFEPSWHDNSIKGAKQTPRQKGDDNFSVETLSEIDLGGAIRFANKKWPKLPVTLYIYDPGSDPIGKGKKYK